MKKQILFLAFFTLALIFAGINKSNGQEKNPPPAIPGAPTVPTCITPTPIVAECTGNPLTPMAGVKYTYEISIGVNGLDASLNTYKWFVTTDQDFIEKDASTLAGVITTVIEPGDGSGPYIATSGTVPASGTNYGAYNDAPNGDIKIEMSWDYFVHDPANPVFLVVYVLNENGVCENDNIEIYIIKPAHSFTLDIASVLPNGTVGLLASDPAYAPEDGPCAATVTSARWVFDPTDANSDGIPDTDGTLEMNYGVNYLYFIVNAANFNDSWLPNFRIWGDGITSAITTDPTFNPDITRPRAVTAVDWQYLAESGDDPYGTPAADLWNRTALNTIHWDHDGDGGTATPTPEVYAFTATGKGANAGADLPVEAQNPSAAGVVSSTGECIIVRVTVANNQIETADAPDPISFAVDGIMYNQAAANATPATDPYVSASLADIHYMGPDPANPGDGCPYPDGFEHDRVVQNITVRPDLIDQTDPDPDDNFVPKN